MSQPQIYHVVPRDDIKPHSLSLGLPCECETRNERQSNGDWLVVHNAYDAREFYEPGRKQEEH